MVRASIPVTQTSLEGPTVRDVCVLIATLPVDRRTRVPEDAATVHRAIHRRIGLADPGS
jgi:hypothetical protein